MAPKVFVVSRCFWTLKNFRVALLHRLSRMPVQLTCAGGNDSYRADLNAAGFRTRCLPVDRRGISIVNDIRLLLSMYRWYREEKPAVVHHFTIKPVIYGSIAARLAGIPKVVNTITGLGYAFTESRSLIRIVAMMLYRVALRRCSRVFFQNQEDRDFFIQRGLVDEDICQLVPGSGVDLTRFDEEETEHAELRIDCLMVSRLLGDKGVRDFVKAAKLLRDQNPQLNFTILGALDGRNPSAIGREEVNRWQASGDIHWHDQVDDVRPFIRQSKMVVLPSYREGTPRSLLEAAAMGKPVVATDVVGCREVVQDGINGFLVEVRNPAALVNAIERLLGSEELRSQFGKAGRRLVEERFNEKVVIDRAIDAYGILMTEEHSAA